MNFLFFFEQFSNSNIMMNDIGFYFKDDKEEVEHFIGYMPEYKDGRHTVKMINLIGRDYVTFLTVVNFQMPKNWLKQKFTMGNLYKSVGTKL